MHQVLQNIMVITQKRRPTVVWDGDEVVHAPDIAVSRLQVDAIAGYMESLR
jgi:hypothetical protein